MFTRLFFLNLLTLHCSTCFIPLDTHKTFIGARRSLEVICPLDLFSLVAVLSCCQTAAEATFHFNVLFWSCICNVRLWSPGEIKDVFSFYIERSHLCFLSSYIRFILGSPSRYVFSEQRFKMLDHARRSTLFVFQKSRLGPKDVFPDLNTHSKHLRTIPLNTDTAGASLILNGETTKCFG